MPCLRRSHALLKTRFEPMNIRLVAVCSVQEVIHCRRTSGNPDERSLRPDIKARSSCTVCDESSHESVDDDGHVGVVDEVVDEQTSRMNLVQQTPKVSLWQNTKNRLSQNRVWAVIRGRHHSILLCEHPTRDRTVACFFRQPARNVNSRDQCGRHPLYRFGQDLW